MKSHGKYWTKPSGKSVNIKEEDYTEDSYKLLEQKITAATNILGKSNATTEEIATAYAELKETINQLIPLGKQQTTTGSG
jgi:hypothetical protein|uniref:hypothetical protein n=1 Tax=Phocaeicola dorei TaxID=357276 RepID=UPI00402640B4